jgi:hypothetical protein
MWTDRHRWLKIGLTVTFIAALAWRYTGFAIDRPEGIRSAMVAPTAHDGALILLPLWRVSAIEGPGRYAVSKVLRDVVVLGTTDGLAVGDTVSVTGVFRAQDSVVVETTHHRHWLRPWKGGLSLLGLLLAFIFAPRFFWWRNHRVVLRG